MSALTKSWLQKQITDLEVTRDEIPFGLDEDGNNTLAALKMALAGMEQEPVYQVLGDGSWTDYSKQQLEDLLESKPSTLFRVAYAAPQLPQPAVVVNRKAIADRVHGQCSRIPGATFYNAAELALDEVEACRAAKLQGGKS